MRIVIVIEGDRITIGNELPKPQVPIKSLYELDLPIRALRALISEGVNTPAELLEKTETELLKMPDMGRRFLGYIKKELSERGWSLKSTG